MKRTQIYIDENTHNYVSQVAAEQGLSMAALIREFIEIGLEKQKNDQQSSFEVMKNIANLKIEGGPEDLSANLDHYLYGAQKN